MAIRRLVLASAVGLAGLCAAGMASASALAVATLQVGNFRWMVDVSGNTDFTSLATYLATSADDRPFRIGTSRTSGVDDVILSSSTDSADAFSDLLMVNPTPISTNGNWTNNALTRDLPQQALRTSLVSPSENDFTAGTAPAQATYVNADQYLEGPIVNVLSGNSSTVALPAGSEAGLRTDVSLKNRTEGSAHANLNNTTTFRPAGNLSVYFEADFLAETIAHLSASEVEDTSFATASVSLTINLRRGSNQVIPLTTVVQLSSGTSWPGYDVLDHQTDNSADLPLGKWYSPKVTLLNNQLHTLTLSTKATSDARSAPEPASLALIGIGALAAGVARRRRRKG